MTELLVGTKKGLFLLQGEPEFGFEIKTRAFAGQPVDFVTRDPRSGRLLATVTSPFYGPKIFYTDSDPGAEWEQADGVALPEGASRSGLRDRRRAAVRRRCATPEATRAAPRPGRPRTRSVASDSASADRTPRA
jgi:hypothetical protein